MKKRAQKIKNFFKTIIAGLIGAGIFFMFSILAFAIAKIIFIIMKKDLIVTRYNILATVAIFVVFGFAYGISSYIKKNSYRKTMTPTWKVITIDVIISLAFAIITYTILKQKYYTLLTSKASVTLFLLLLVMFYAFSAILVQLSRPPKTHKHKVRNIIWAIILNPLFIILALGLFAAIIYNSLYVPCGVTIVGVDKNEYTANTEELGIPVGEKLLSIDDNEIKSLQDVKRYLSLMKTTKEVHIETETQIYYLKTYQSGNTRYMGLLLKQEYCPAE